jgi:hypothetical protein
MRVLPLKIKKTCSNFSIQNLTFRFHFWCHFERDSSFREDIHHRCPTRFASGTVDTDEDGLSAPLVDPDNVHHQSSCRTRRAVAGASSRRLLVVLMMLGASCSRP